MTAQHRFEGVVPPVITPLTGDGQVDVGSLERLVAFLIEAGVEGLFVLGSSGEVAYLTDEQRAQVVKVAVATASGQVPVVSGAIDMTTARVIQHGVAARELGADAVVATAPFYVRTHPSEIDRHFREIASAVDLPVMAYDIPAAVHTKLSTDLLLQLGRDGVIAGVKDSSGDDVSFRRLVIGARDVPGLSVLTGHEVVVDACLLMGADGVVPGLGNVDPHGYVRLLQAARAGDWDGARREQERLAELFRIVDVAPVERVSRSAAGLGSFKTALALRGVIAGNTMATPMQSLDDDETAAIRALLDQAGLLG